MLSSNLQVFLLPSKPCGWLHPPPPNPAQTDGKKDALPRQATSLTGTSHHQERRECAIVSHGAQAESGTHAHVGPDLKGSAYIRDFSQGNHLQERQDVSPVCTTCPRRGSQYGTELGGEVVTREVLRRPGPLSMHGSQFPEAQPSLCKMGKT